jgi:4,4'-diaponeurosporenoate glycosyltransferase
VVPARDEGAVLPDSLAAVMGQVGPGDEVVVVDDHSTDDTQAVAAAAGATVVPAPPLPPGWTGKAWACATGAAATTGEVLCFLDADTTLAPGALDRLVGAQADAGGLVSAQPYHRVPRPYERLSALFNVVALMGADGCTPLGDRRRPGGAFGPALVVSRGDYDELGGHASVAG